MSAQNEYEKWVAYSDQPESIRKELEEIRGDERAIEDRFGHSLDFGTGGLRGVLGAGLNRMNIHTIRRVSYAFAEYVLAEYGDAARTRGVVVGYDCRHWSKEFAETTGTTFAAVGIKAFVSPVLCPTPELSYYVRHYGAFAGVMITASHNPPEYNGYKVYGPDGCQLLPEPAKKVRDRMDAITDVFHLPQVSVETALDQGTFAWVEESVREQYIAVVVKEVKAPQVTDEMRSTLSIVYTPLHGTGLVPTTRVLSDAGYSLLEVVLAQAQPDGNFSTVKSPNPEEPAALQMGIDQAVGISADILMGTDPDADRVGIAARDKDGVFHTFTGNQVGALLLDFLLSGYKHAGTLPSNGIVFKTIVTSELGRAVADYYGVPVEDTLTGFKFIGSKITEYERTGEHQFLFGYEESYGYLISPIVRDKDAPQACLLIAEMAAWYKAQGLTLLDALEALFKRHGYYKESLISVTIKGQDGLEKMKDILNDIRKSSISIPGMEIVDVEDYETLERTFLNGKPAEKLLLPQSDVLKFFFKDGSWLALRPSGTEPKLKVYVAAKGESWRDCEEKNELMSNVVRQLVEQ